MVATSPPCGKCNARARGGAGGSSMDANRRQVWGQRGVYGLQLSIPLVWISISGHHPAKSDLLCFQCWDIQDIQQIWALRQFHGDI